jgi:hypothetical protein
MILAKDGTIYSLLVGAVKNFLKKTLFSRFLSYFLENFWCGEAPQLSNICIRTGRPSARARKKLSGLATKQTSLCLRRSLPRLAIELNANCLYAKILSNFEKSAKNHRLGWGSNPRPVARKNLGTTLLKKFTFSLS